MDNYYHGENIKVFIDNQLKRIKYLVSEYGIEDCYLTKQLFKDLVRFGMLNDGDKPYKVYNNIHKLMYVENPETYVKLKISKKELLVLKKVIEVFIANHEIHENYKGLYFNYIVHESSYILKDLFKDCISVNYDLILQSLSEKNNMDISKHIDSKRLYKNLDNFIKIKKVSERKLKKTEIVELKKFEGLVIPAKIITKLVGVPKFLNARDEHKELIFNKNINTLVHQNKINIEDYKKLQYNYKKHSGEYGNIIKHSPLYIELKSPKGLIKFGLKEVIKDNKLMYVRPETTYMFFWLDYILAQKSLDIPYELQVSLKRILNI